MFTEVWTFKTARFTVALQIEEEPDYEYDGDDEDGQTQRDIDDGKLVAFDSRVVVFLDGNPVGFDCLGGSVYEDGNVSDFWRDHWTSPYEYRNTLELKAQHRSICHYFPSMVAEAIRVARIALGDIPKLRVTS